MFSHLYDFESYLTDSLKKVTIQGLILLEFMGIKYILMKNCTGCLPHYDLKLLITKFLFSKISRKEKTFKLN